MGRRQPVYRGGPRGVERLVCKAFLDIGSYGDKVEWSIAKSSAMVLQAQARVGRLTLLSESPST